MNKIKILSVAVLLASSMAWAGCNEANDPASGPNSPQGPSGPSDPQKNEMPPSK